MLHDSPALLTETLRRTTISVKRRLNQLSYSVVSGLLLGALLFSEQVWMVVSLTMGVTLLHFVLLVVFRFFRHYRHVRSQY